MLKDENLLNLIVVEQDSQTVSQLERVCREAGYTAAIHQASTADALRDALRRQPWDLIVAGSQEAGVSVAEVTAAVTAEKCDAPVVVIAPAGDDASIAQILHAGVRDVAVLEPADRLIHIIRRETGDLRDRRALKHYKKVLEEYEQRLLYFLGRAEKRQAGTVTAEQPSTQIDAVDPAVSDVENNTTADHTSRMIDAAANTSPAPAPVEAMAGRPSFLDALSGVLSDNATRPGYRAVLYIDVSKDAVSPAWDERATQVFFAGIEAKLREALASPFLVARYDDFVFVALISHGERQGLVKAAHGVKHAIEGGGIQVAGREVTAACSIGVCLVDHNTQRASGVIANARTACEKAAAAGGKRISFFGPSPTVSGNKPTAVSAPAARPVPAPLPAARAPVKGPRAARLQTALNDNRFRLVFQPVVHFHAAPTETYEILLRMIDEKGREVMPSEFIPEAEASGLMQEIDRWVVKTAATALQQRRESGFSTRLFVKLSAESIGSREFPAWLEEMLNIMQLAPESLVFQLSEAVVSKHLDRSREFIQLVTTMGCGAALDHFGMLKNSLDMARDLPVKYLKIHGELIQSLARDMSSQRLLKEIVDTARASNKVTIASFVQDPYILSILWRCRVDYVQGFYFQPPKPAMAYDFTSAIS